MCRGDFIIIIDIVSIIPSCLRGYSIIIHVHGWWGGWTWYDDRHIAMGGGYSDELYWHEAGGWLAMIDIINH